MLKTQLEQEMADEIAALEMKLEAMERQKTMWWRLACGRFRILDNVKEKILPVDEYYAWAEKYIDDEMTKLDEIYVLAVTQ